MKFKTFLKEIIKEVIILFLILFVTLFILMGFFRFVKGVDYSTINKYSVINYSTTGNKYLINCLGNNNIIFVFSNNNTLIYKSDCNNQIYIYKNIIDKSTFINIKNNPNNKNYLDYKEFTNLNNYNNVGIKPLIKEIGNKICFQLDLNFYAQIKINNEPSVYTNHFYKCYNKDYLLNKYKNNTIYLYLYLNNKIITDYVLKNDNNQITASFNDLSLMNKDDKQFIISLKNSNPQKVIKARIIDTNIKCNKKDFILSNDYNLICNYSTNNKALLYYIQLQASNNKYYYFKYQKVEMNNTNSKLNSNYLIVGFILLIIILYFYYNKKIKDREKKTIETINEDIEDK